MYEFLDKRYALALYEVAESKNKIDEFLRDFEDIVDILKYNEECKTLISHPQISTREKRDIFTKMFKGRIDDELLSFLLILIDKKRIEYAEEKLIEMKKIDLERRNIQVVDVKTVIPMDDEDRKNLMSRLENKYKKKIILNEEVDKSILGGIFLKVGNDIIDATLRNRLQSIRTHIISREEQ